MCGEYNLRIRKDLDQAGSPPHVWRILAPAIAGSFLPRITSTCVENTPVFDWVNKKW